MGEQIKRLYEEAAQLYEQAKAIMAEYDGKDMPQEKANQVDALLDQVEAKTEEAKRLERMADNDKHLNDPVTQKKFFQTQAQGQDGSDGDDGQPTRAKAFAKFLRYGEKGLTAEEFKALVAGEDPAGGYLVEETFLAELVAKEREASAMRRICRVLPPVPSGSVIVPTEDSEFTDAEWTAEVATGSADTVEPFGQRNLTPHALAKRVLVSNTLLRRASFDVEAWVRERMAYRFAVPEENGFINGDGNGKPLGILNTPNLPTYTTATSNQVYGNDIINWVYSLPAAYAAHPSCRILCNRAFIRKVRALHTMENAVEADNYIWQPGLAQGEPNRILDIEYELSDRFDDGLDANDAWEDDAVVAVIGAWDYYWIVDALGMTIQRLVELYAETNQTGFIGRKETDGMAVLAEAFYALKVKA